jgi:hypothetical protein
MEERKRRYVGIDLGKRAYTMAIIGRNGKMSIHTGKTSIQGRQVLYKQLEVDDKIALEAGNVAFIMAREIGERVGGEIQVRIWRRRNAGGRRLWYCADRSGKRRNGC